jgi:polysaccharide biosynthesis/export protein
MKSYFGIYVIAFLLIGSTACTTNKQSRFMLFRTDGRVDNAVFAASIAEAEKNYVINRFDNIGVELFTNKGEIILDPNRALQNQTQNQTMPNGAFNPNNPTIAAAIADANNPVSTIYQMNTRGYLINDDGMVYLPLIGGVKVAGLKMYQADSLFSQMYAKHYIDVYAVTKLQNRRVIIMGALGNKVMNMPYESMHLLEILTLASSNQGGMSAVGGVGGIGMPGMGVMGGGGMAAGTALENNSRTDRIKIIRNILSGKPIIQVVDLTAWESIKQANLRIEPNDVIYVEPRRRVGEDVQRDTNAIISLITTVSSIVTSLITTYFLYQTLTKQP